MAWSRSGSSSRRDVLNATYGIAQAANTCQPHSNQTGRPDPWSVRGSTAAPPVDCDFADDEGDCYADEGF